MNNIKRNYLLLGVVLVCLLCIVSFPVSAFSQDLKSSTPSTSSGNTSEGISQKNDLEDFFARYNGCSWLRMPFDPSCDIFLELSNRKLILYRYLKDEGYCWITSTICFSNSELLRIEVTGYEIVSTDQNGNEFRVVISRDGGTITIHGKDNLGFMENVIGTFVKLFCSGNR
ncbi:MAG TPA: hypothetical protein DDW17_04675 [Deltaproteobacteria bacterium]|nr:hypothetical protein [Deltaproteobacteria bacterium]